MQLHPWLDWQRQQPRAKRRGHRLPSWILSAAGQAAGWLRQGCSLTPQAQRSESLIPLCFAFAGRNFLVTIFLILLFHPLLSIYSFNFNCIVIFITNDLQCFQGVSMNLTITSIYCVRAGCCTLRCVMLVQDTERLPMRRCSFWEDA